MCLRTYWFSMHILISMLPSDFVLIISKVCSFLLSLVLLFINKIWTTTFHFTLKLKKRERFILFFCHVDCVCYLFLDQLSNLNSSIYILENIIESGLIFSSFLKFEKQAKSCKIGANVE